MAFCLSLPALARPHLMPFALAGLLCLAAIASVSLAVLRADQPLAPHLTAWDEAALLFTASHGLHLWLGALPTS